MTPEVPSTQPEKSPSSGTPSPRLEEKRPLRPWKRLIVALASVVAMTMIALLENTPKKEPVKVWFVRSTNYLAYEKLIFQVRNGLPREINVYALIAAGDRDQAKTRTVNSRWYDRAFATAAARTNFCLALEVPRHEKSYYVEWGFHDPGAPAPRWSRLRIACNKIFRALGVPDLTDHSLPRDEVRYIPSTEIKE